MPYNHPLASQEHLRRLPDRPKKAEQDDLPKKFTEENDLSGVECLSVVSGF